jgi:predicted nucleic acid-binding protein
MQPVLIDTGVIFALLDRNERAHQLCVQALQGLYRPLVTCEAVISESCYLLRHRPDIVNALLANITNGFFQIRFDLTNSVLQVQKLLEKYRDTPVDFADACLIQMADELDTGDILTLDSDFRHYRWRRNRSFQFLV